MADPGKNDHWLVRRSTIRGLWLVFIAMLALTVIADLVVQPQGKFGIDGTIGFYAWYGLLSCVVLIVGALGFGKVLKRRDQYYGA